MDVEVLDEFPPWMIYSLASIVTCGFGLSVTILIRSWQYAYTATHRLDQYRRQPERKLPLFSGYALLFSLVGGVALWFFYTAMFVWFHAMAIGSDHIDLIFFWPRAQEVIPIEDFTNINFIPSHRSCGYFELSTKGNVYKSVSFKRCEVAQEIIQKLSRQ